MWHKLILFLGEQSINWFANGRIEVTWTWRF